ncbi:hypothetical protein QOZ80_9BG0694470 [Eleusine coracana subsp. coracana]|nr:hypothetical protein QOZ80_9BG0694470 [Eleusine coracana subsp. coracana]
MDLDLSLPDDVLAGVLGRLTPRYLAVSRCVCKAWRHVVDTNRLLHADLLPLSLGGIFFNYQDLWFTQFLSRPTTGAVVSGRLDYTVPGNSDGMPLIYVKDYCNGLLLLRHCVVNPATQQWAFLPPRPPLAQPLPNTDIEHIFREEYLVFDPTISPNYELFIVPQIPFNLNESEESEWPPSTLILSVLSSKTGSWEERAFNRDGVTVRTLPGMIGSVRFRRHQCGYWREALYICCSDYFVMRISLSDNKYQVIRLIAEDGGPKEQQDFYLGQSDKGIYCASFFQKSHLQVWFLNNQTEWVLKHDRDISPVLPNLDKYNIKRGGPWILQEFNYWEDDVQHSDDEDYSIEEVNDEAIVDVTFMWDSDNDNVLEPGRKSNVGYMDFLGFHPFKEVVFLMSDRLDRVLAYNWSTSKLQDLDRYGHQPPISTRLLLELAARTTQAVVRVSIA